MNRRFNTTARRAAWACLAAALLSLSAPAHAMRCGHRLISEGDASVKLLRHCGEPLSVRSYHAQRFLVGHFGRIHPGYVEEVLVEEWTYNFGPRRLMRVVRIENGLVTDIEHLGYGFLPSD